jgi:hypothetical protein
MSEAVQITSPLAELDLHAEALRSDALYLDRCQVDTPSFVVDLVWAQVRARRSRPGRVVDFGAGDARFAVTGQFKSYVGYEVDARRAPTAPAGIHILPQCAFSHSARDADVCVGNPPYVRNQDLPLGWREMASSEVRRRTGVSLSGLANAWQYFLMLGLWSTKDDGLLALVLPYEWVTRPAASPIRAYISESGWGVDVYRLDDGTFDGVLTAASITVIDKRGPAGWRFHRVDSTGTVAAVPSATGGSREVLAYRRVTGTAAPRAKRGLSPGTQRALTLTEGERVHAGLRVGADVVRCVTSLRSVALTEQVLSTSVFENCFVNEGEKCWLIRTDKEPSRRLRKYIDSVEESVYSTATCLARKDWWRFSMPDGAPGILIAQAFKGLRPKVVVNEVNAMSVGGVAGIFNLEPAGAARLVNVICKLDLHDRVVAYAKQMRKIEINQINALLSELMPSLSS